MSKDKRLFLQGKQGKSTKKHAIKSKSAIQKLINLPGRDGTLMALMVFTGLRSQEVRNLRWMDIMTKGGKVKKHLKLMIAKQSNLTQEIKYRHILMVDALIERLEAHYVSSHKPPLFRFVFYPKRHMKVDQPMSRVGLNDIIKRCAEKVGIKDWKKLAAHSFRKTMIMDYLEVTDYNWPLVCAMMNYANQATLMSYLDFNVSEIEAGFQDKYTPGAKGESLMDRFMRGEININLDLMTAEYPVHKWVEVLEKTLSLFEPRQTEVIKTARQLLVPYISKQHA